MKNERINKFLLSAFILLFSISIIAQWRMVQSPVSTNFNSAVQLTSSKAFIVGDNGVLLKTTDSGYSWTTVDLKTKPNLNSIRSIDNFSSYIVGDNGLILWTNTLWLDWENYSVAENYHNQDIAVFSSKKAIIVGSKTRSIYSQDPVLFPSILVKNNYGYGWIDRSLNIPGKLNSIVCFGTDRAIAVGDNGLVAYTADGGTSWRTSTITTKNLNQIKICKSGMIIAVGDKGSIFVTKEPERISPVLETSYRWTNLSISFLYNLKSVCMKDEHTLIVAGQKIRRIPDGTLEYDAVILQSINLSRDWTELLCEPGGYFNAVNFCNSTNAIAAGEKGIIAVYKAPGISVYNTTVTEVKPANQIILIRNYPNPFNPSTTITYTIPEDNFVTLKIYNALGEEVATLVNEFNSAGTYYKNFDASNLAGGVYIYTIQSGDYYKTQKMLLLK